MAEYTARVLWNRQPGESYVNQQYSRGHEWIFDGGVTVLASASPHVVPLPYSVAEHVDPEEAFIAALSSCHMLFFLSIASQRRFVVDEYRDDALGVLAKDAEGKLAMTRVTLRPKIIFSGDRQPSSAQIETMHHQSHKQCFIANSVKTEVVVETVNA